MRTAFTNATIWTAAGDPFEGATLLIEDGKVVDVGVEAALGDAEVVDCSGKVLTPGFIDCHSHAGISGEGVMGDGDVNEMSEPIAPHVRMLDAIHPEDLGFLDARRGGVTTMGITHGSALAIGGQVAATKTAGTSNANNSSSRVDASPVSSVSSSTMMKPPSSPSFARARNSVTTSACQRTCSTSKPPFSRRGASSSYNTQIGRAHV